MKVVFTTGAGISVPSGLKPYRGTGGIYTDNPNLENILHKSTLITHPDLVWKHIEAWKAEVDECKPNEAHHAIAKLESRHEVTVITQNIDGYHELVGSTNVIELHGNIHKTRTEDYVEMPDVVLFGQDVPSDKYHQAVLAIENADIIIAVGTSGTVYPAANLLDIANDRAHTDGIHFLYISLDDPEMYLPFAKIIIGSADTIVPSICTFYKPLIESN